MQRARMRVGVNSEEVMEEELCTPRKLQES